jgi:hypothetical protein
MDLFVGINTLKSFIQATDTKMQEESFISSAFHFGKKQGFTNKVEKLVYM